MQTRNLQLENAELTHLKVCIRVKMLVLLGDYFLIALANWINFF